MLAVINSRKKNSLCLLFLLFINTCYSLDPKTYIPKNAELFIPVVKTETNNYFHEIPLPHYVSGLIEQESCISLTNKRCWSPVAELNTSREYGAGIGMLTKAFRSDGSVRFDSLSSLRAQHMSELSELNWDNIKARPDLQIRALLLMSRDNYRALYKVQDPIERLKMTDAAYNAGLGRVNKDRIKCNLTEGCDAQVWDNNVETTCTASRTPIQMYGNKSPCRINREHVYNVFELRMPKYRQFYNDKTPPLIQPIDVVDTPKIPTYWDRRFYLDYFF